MITHKHSPTEENQGKPKREKKLPVHTKSNSVCALLLAEPLSRLSLFSTADNVQLKSRSFTRSHWKDEIPQRKFKQEAKFYVNVSYILHIDFLYPQFLHGMIHVLSFAFSLSPFFFSRGRPLMGIQKRTVLGEEHAKRSV